MIKKKSATFSIAFISMLFHHKKNTGMVFIFLPCFGSRFFSSKNPGMVFIFLSSLLWEQIFLIFSLSFVSGKSKVMSLFKTTIVAEDIPQAVIFAGSNIHFLNLIVILRFKKYSTFVGDLWIQKCFLDHCR